jgi:hypothetical protein
MYNLYEVDYNVHDVEAYKANPPNVPAMVLAADLHTAHKLASKYENENLSLRDLRLAKENVKLAMEKGYKGI